MDEKVIRALGDANRIKLLTLMSEHGYCVRALSLLCGISESAVSQHLKVMRGAGLISGEKKGYYTHYRIEKEELIKVRDELDLLIKSIPCPCTDRASSCTVAGTVCGERRKGNTGRC